MKLATIGSGTIVETFLAACIEVEGIELKDVYSRTHETGLTLADKFGITVVFTDLGSLYAEFSTSKRKTASDISVNMDRKYFFSVLT